MICVVLYCKLIFMGHESMILFNWATAYIYDYEKRLCMDCC